MPSRLLLLDLGFADDLDVARGIVAHETWKRAQMLRALRRDFSRRPASLPRPPRLRYTVFPEPKITVTWLDSTPPLPCASATSQSFTCAGPRSPRIWRTASISRKMPYMPGWQ